MAQLDLRTVIAYLMWTVLVPLSSSAFIDDFTFTACADNVSVAGDCTGVPTDALVWWDMSRASTRYHLPAGTIEALPFPNTSSFLASLQLMWITNANVARKESTVRDYANTSRVPLYVMTSGSVATDRRTLVYDQFLTGLDVFTGGWGVTTQYVALAPDGTIIVQSSTGDGCVVDAANNSVSSPNCSLDMQLRFDPFGTEYEIVFRTVNISLLAQRAHYGLSVGSRITFYQDWNASIQGRLLRSNGTSSAHEDDDQSSTDPTATHATVAGVIQEGAYIRIFRNDTVANLCLAARTCWDCVLVTQPGSNTNACVFLYNVNGAGVCVPEAYQPMLDSSSMPANRVFQCTGFANVSRNGPCFRLLSSCLVQQALDADHDAAILSLVSDASSRNDTSFRLIPKFPDELDLLDNVRGRIPQAGVYNATIDLVNTVRLSMKFTTANPSSDLVLTLSTSSDQRASAALVLPSYKFRDFDPAVLLLETVPTKSRWCSPPYMQPSACNATTIVMGPTLDLDRDNGPPIPIFVIQYFHNSAVVAVHTVSDPETLVIDIQATTTPLTLTSLNPFGNYFSAASPYLSAAPNRSVYFVTPYTCLVACVKGECNEDGQCVCIDPTQWRGVSCNIPVGIYNVSTHTTNDDPLHYDISSPVVLAECPSCGVFGSCLTNGTCLCSPGYSGPRCEMHCPSSVANTRDACIASTTLRTCSGCSCFAGTAWNATLRSCAPNTKLCNFSNNTGALLSNHSCSIMHHRNDGSGLAETISSSVMLGVCILAVIALFVLQWMNCQRKRAAYHARIESS